MEVPGDIYLCQVSETVSCGACCGLYNAAEPSRASLENRLLHRTEAFAQVGRDPESIQAFALAIEAREPRKRPLPGFYHCPFVGLIGPGRSCVGCLLHPMAQGNDGVDLRGLSHYGGMACKICFCPAYRVLSPSHREILRKTAEDWHSFGILVTEALTLERLFQHVEALTGGPLTMKAVAEGRSGPAAVRDLFGLVLDWPFRRKGFPLGTYFLGDDQVRKGPVDYGAAGAGPSRYDPIFQELASQFSSPADLERAEEMLHEVLAALAEALKESCRFV